MSVDINKLIKLNNLATTASRRKHIIVLKPEDMSNNLKNFDANIVYDDVIWDFPSELQTLVKQLYKNTQLSNEEKILIVYEKLCKDYVYDDNVLSYIKKVDDDSFALPNWYAKNVDRNWKDNREQHNRRVCYEVSRYLAKALSDLFKDQKDYNISILYDKSLTHYFVGLTCDDYSITLDTDDFNNIKDLTRIKSGLTAEGIIILEDKKGKVNYALNTFNEGRSKDAVKKIEHDIIYNNSDNSIADLKNKNSEQIEENEDIIFLKNVIEILKDEYGVDSQGLFEYIKEIVDIKLGPEARKKVWKELKGTSNKSTRYIRCLEILADDKKYLIDVDKALIRPFDEKEFDDPETDFIRYKELQRNWREPYDGS